MFLNQAAGIPSHPPVPQTIVYETKRDMLIGYTRISKTDGSQALDLQKDALIEAGVDAQHIYEDHASGK